LDTGVTREAAYEVVQRCSSVTWESGEHLREVLARDPDNSLSAAQLEEAFDPAWYLRYISDVYRRFGM
jgi:adenylosuccinate lyase